MFSYLKDIKNEEEFKEFFLDWKNLCNFFNKDLSFEEAFKIKNIIKNYNLTTDGLLCKPEKISGLPEDIYNNSYSGDLSKIFNIKEINSNDKNDLMKIIYNLKINIRDFSEEKKNERKGIVTKYFYDLRMSEWNKISKTRKDGLFTLLDKLILDKEISSKTNLYDYLPFLDYFKNYDLSEIFLIKNYNNKSMNNPVDYDHFLDKLNKNSLEQLDISQDKNYKFRITNDKLKFGFYYPFSKELHMNNQKELIIPKIELIIPKNTLIKYIKK